MIENNQLAEFVMKLFHDKVQSKSKQEMLKKVFDEFTFQAVTKKLNELMIKAHSKNKDFIDDEL